MGNEKRSTPVASAYPQQAGFLSQLSDGPKEFMKESIHLVNRCTKPDRREFIKVAQAVAVGFLIIGGIGFVIKLVHIPINNIIMGV